MDRVIRVLVVDDHPIVRDGLGTLLDQEHGFALAGRADHPTTALKMIADTKPDVDLCDLYFGERPLGFDLLRSLRKVADAPPVVLFSQFASNSIYRMAIKHGAVGYLTKDAPTTDIAHALRSAVAGRTTFSIAAVRAAHEAPEIPNPQEMSIIEGVARGDKTAVIATNMELAYKTIEGRLSILFRRYNVGSRTALVAKAMEEGWINMIGEDALPPVFDPTARQSGVDKPVMRRVR